MPCKENCCQPLAQASAVPPTLVAAPDAFDFVRAFLDASDPRINSESGAVELSGLEKHLDTLPVDLTVTLRKLVI
ncbi:MAG: hypothetical protein DCC68_22650 [Planctomycetota bacterium]|nr:MAG: hypothetical protein DCC68_22650 [Planctomycetota bacterium]